MEGGGGSNSYCSPVKRDKAALYSSSAWERERGPARVPVPFCMRSPMDICCMASNSLQQGVASCEVWDRKGFSGWRKYSRTLTRDRPK